MTIMKKPISELTPFECLILTVFVLIVIPTAILIGLLVLGFQY